MTKKNRPSIPPLLGSSEVSKLLGIKISSLPNYRKLKTFPEPIVFIGNRPAWLESEILEYKEGRDKKKEDSRSE